MSVISKETIELILAANVVFALLYLLTGLLYAWIGKGDGRRCVFTFCVLLLCPVAGFLILLLSHAFHRLFFRKDVNLADVIFSKDKVSSLQRSDYEAEANFVPLEEALAVSDRKSLRGLMLDVLKRDVEESLGSISRALTGSDSETAHYAASVLRDELNTFREQVAQKYQRWKDGYERAPEAGEELIEYMNRLLEQRVFTKMEQKAFVDILEDTGELLYQRSRERIRPAHLEAIGLRLLETGAFDRCEKWCQRGSELFGNELIVYTLRMKLLFAQGRGEEMFEVMNALKRSDIVIDRETLDLIRTFEQESEEKEETDRP